jgi:hypothetical protein
VTKGATGGKAAASTPKVLSIDLYTVLVLALCLSSTNAVLLLPDHSNCLFLLLLLLLLLLLPQCAVCSAADSQRIYVSNNNNDAIAVDLTKMKAVPNKPGATAAPTTTKGGLTAAVDAYDGTLLWTFANPTMHCKWDIVCCCCGMCDVVSCSLAPLKCCRDCICETTECSWDSNLP